MKVTYYGHACFAIETNGVTILTDPFISPNELAKAVDANAIHADYILVSHGHMDHVADLVSIAKRTNAKVVCAFELMGWLNQQGVDNVHPMNTGGKWHFEAFTVKCVNAVHSSVLPDGTYGANPMGFVFWNDEGCGYFAGDTALTMDMKLIPMICPKLSFAILPIGDNFTMGYEDAAIAAEFIDCANIVGAHFDTFGYIKIDHEAAKKAFEAKGKALILPTIGKSLTI